jgi:hypothetical protein
MRGNSRCDPILSITTTENRILINTEFNILLMEFEQVIFEYGCNKDDVGDKNTADQQELMKKSKNYSSIRASRSELVATPNVKLFNDDRKSVLEHSSRPISGKNLKDAHLVNTISSKPTNLPKNSIGNLSESALLKRQFIVQAINDTIISRTSLSVLSNHRSASNMNHQNYHPHNYFERDDLYESSFNNFGHGSGDPRSRNLYEAKLFLRDQLKEMKQNQQSNESENPDGIKTKRSTKTNDPTETESCVETRVVNRDTIMSKYESTMSTLTRPTSSPSKYDTKTKIKGKPQEYKNKYVIDEEEKIKSSLTESSTKFQTQTLVSKVFESSEAALQTNTNMHPVNVKSKLPNPKIIRPQTVPENSEEPRWRFKSSSFKIARSKTANQQSAEQSQQVPLLMGPKLNTTTNKLVVRSSRKTANENGEKKENNRLSSHDNLNLMTYKDVDRIVDTINSYYLHSPQKSQELQQADFYKKIWMLKSTGQYHGSLLVKPSSRAPEIRE